MKSETSVLVVFSDAVPAIRYLRRSLWVIAAAARQIASKLAPTYARRESWLAAAARQIASELAPTYARCRSQLAGEGVGSRSLLAAILVCGAALPTPSLAENTVRFHGSVVHATCNIQPLNQAGNVEGPRLELAPGVTYQIQATANACDGQAAPFIAHYTPLQIPASKPTRSDKAGVVTVTYQ